MVKCRFCEKEITQDRYNINFEWERQDFPMKSNWQKSSFSYLENVCSNCYHKIENQTLALINYLKANKGKLPNE